MLDPQPWLRAATAVEPERRFRSALSDKAAVLTPRAEYEQDHDQYSQPTDFDTVEGCIRVSTRAAEKLGMDISAAYEEMDGVSRPMATPMGRLLHDGLGSLMQIKAMGRFIQRRHDAKIAELQAELDFARASDLALIESAVKIVLGMPETGDHADHRDLARAVATLVHEAQVGLDPWRIEQFKDEGDIWPWAVRRTWPSGVSEFDSSHDIKVNAITRADRLNALARGLAPPTTEGTIR
jgi:hypothetical protein